MKKLLIYLKDYRRESLLGPLFKLLEAGLDLIVPLVIAALIDTGIEQNDPAYIARMCLVLVGLGIVGLGAAIIAQYYAAKASVGFVTKLRHALFAHVQRLSYSELDALGSATIITRMTSDMNQVQNGVNLALRLLLRSPFIVFGAAIMAFTIDVPSALVFAVAIPVLFAVVFAIMLLCIPLYKKVQALLDRVLGTTRENLTGVRVIRAFRKEQDEEAEFSRRNEALTKMQKFVGRISALMNPLTFVVVNLAVVWLIHTGAVRVEAGLLTQGAVVALYNYMSQILVELIKMANLILTLTKAVACGNRIQAVLELQPQMHAPEQMPAPVSTEAAVEFRHVDFRFYDAAENALSALDFTVAAGQTVGIIGGTGSGKSTLVNLIPRFYDTTGGSVLVNGVDVRDYPVKALRSMIGIVPQKAVLFHGTIRDNLRWGREDATDAELMEAAAAAQAAEIIQGKAGGLDANIEQGGRNLSGGQRQRLTIARALVRKPQILILDDSASALDLATDAALRKALAALPFHPTTFIVSQRTASLRHADRILVLDDGQLVGAGTHEELLTTCPIYREIYDSQFQPAAKEAVPK